MNVMKTVGGEPKNLDMNDHMDKLTIPVDNLMIPIPGGMEHLRDYRDEQKWMSSDAKMSGPGQRRNLKATEKLAEVQPFLMAKYAVTDSLYQAVVNQIPLDAANDKPVVNVSWHDAIRFCNRLSRACGLDECYALEKDGGSVSCDWNADGYRLPTDAEWQHACRAGSTGYRYGRIEDIAWYGENSEGMIHAVGQKKPNDWGLYDMLGNVWEWCWDVYDEKSYGEYRVFRGGSWAESARGCGATCRRRGHPSFSIDDLGFRLARSIKIESFILQALSGEILDKNQRNK